MPVLLMVIFAITRWPDLMPLNFSAAYALVFCCAVYLPRRIAWWLPLTTLFVTDLLKNYFYYHTDLISAYMLVNYAAFAAIVVLGQRFSPKTSWLFLVTGGLAGATLFYIITNTAAWLQNPEYAKTLSGWIQALTIGTPGWPPTWTFFRNTLLSGGMFTGLFVGAMKLSESAAEQQEPEEEKEPEGEAGAPEESKA